MKQTIKNLFRCTIALAALLIVSTANAKEAETFEITKAETTNGSFAVTVGGAAAETAAAGATVTITATPSTGYEADGTPEVSVTTSWGKAGTRAEISVEETIEVTAGTTANTWTFTMPNDDVTVSMAFKKGTYTITVASDITGGTITAKNGSEDITTAQEGDEITLTATPAEGYELEAFSVKDAAGNAVTVTDGKFTMPAGTVTISATFKETVRKVVDETKPVKTEDGLTLYELTDHYKKAIDIVDGVTIALSENANIQADADSEGHLVVQKGNEDVEMLLKNISAGSEIVFEYSGYIICPDGTLVKASGSKARTRGVEEMSVEPGATYKVLKDCDIRLTLKTSKADVKIVSITIRTVEYDVIIAKTTNGDIISSKINAQAGEQVNLKVTSDENYQLASLSVKDEKGKDLYVGYIVDPKEGPFYYFKMPIGKVLVSGTFEEDLNLSVVVAKSENGEVISSIVNSRLGKQVNLKAIPEEGYELDELFVVDADGRSIPLTFVEDTKEGPINFFIMPETDVKVHATFKKIKSDTSVPTITTQPESVTYVVGDTEYPQLSIEATTTVGDLTYEWFLKNDEGTYQSVGITTSELGLQAFIGNVIELFRDEAIGDYTFMCKVSNVNGTVESDPATLTIAAGDPSAVKTIKTDVQVDGIRKYVKNGKIVIETPRGLYSISGAQIK